MESLVMTFPFLSSIHSVTNDVCRLKTFILDD